MGLAFNDGVWVGANDEGIFVSTDGGLTWVNKVAQGAGYSRGAIAFDGIGTWLVGGGLKDDLMRSEDNGQTWDPVTPTMPTSSAGFIPYFGKIAGGQVDGNSVWVAFAKNNNVSTDAQYDLIYSEDDGETWSASTFDAALSERKFFAHGLNFGADGDGDPLWVAHTRDGDIVCADIGGKNECAVMYSSDGKNWSKGEFKDEAGAALSLADRTIYSMAYSPVAEKWVATGRKVLASSTDGKTWTNHDFPLPVALTYQIKDTNAPGGFSDQTATISGQGSQVAAGVDFDGTTPVWLVSLQQLSFTNEPSAGNGDPDPYVLKREFEWALLRSTDGETWERIPGVESNELIATVAFGEGVDASDSNNLRPYNRFIAAGPGFVYTLEETLPPLAPTDLSASPIAGGFDIAFTAPIVSATAPIQAYEYSTDDGVSWALIGGTGAYDVTSPVPVTKESSDVTAFVVGQEYGIKLRAVNRGGRGEASAEVSATVLAAPDAPENVRAAADLDDPLTGQDRNFLIEWDAVEGATGYGVEWRNGGSVTDSGFTFLSCAKANLENVDPLPTSCQLSFDQFFPWSTYEVRVYAENGAGRGTESAWVPIIVAPPTPSVKKIDLANKTIELNAETPSKWSSFDNAPPDFSLLPLPDYRLIVQPGNQSFSCQYDFNVPSASCDVSSLAAGDYTFQAIGSLGSADSKPSEPASLSFSAPGVPTNIAISPGPQAATVTFGAPTSGGAISNFEYRVSTNGGSTWIEAGDGSDWVAMSPAVNSSPFVIDRLPNGERFEEGVDYTIQVRATNSFGDGDASSSYSVEPSAAVLPDAPTNLVATVGDQLVDVSFDLDNDGGSDITGFDYQLSTDGGANWTDWTPVTPATGSSPVRIDGLTNDTEYVVRLRAINAVGESAASDASSAFTPKPPLFELLAGDQRITVSWSLDDFDLTNTSRFLLNMAVGQFGAFLYSGCEGQVYSAGNIPIDATECTLTEFRDLSGNDPFAPFLNGEFYFVEPGRVVGVGGQYEDPQSVMVGAAVAPEITAVEPGPGSLTISFNAPTNVPVTRMEYTISGSTGSPVVLSDAEKNAGKFTVANLPEGEAITISLQAVSVYDAAKMKPGISQVDGASATASGTTGTSVVVPTKPASKLVIAIDGKVTGIDPQLSNLPFDVVVGLTDEDGNPVANTTTDSTITLTASGGTDTTGRLAKVGALDQPITATLPVGQSSVTITDLVYTGVSAEDGGDITLQASAASGLAGGKSGTSAPFSVRDIILALSADDVSIAADGQSTATITVTLTDADEVPQAGQNIRITTDKGTLLDGTTVVTDTDVFPTDSAGQVQFTLRSDTTPGKVTVTAFCPGACPETLELAFFSQQAVDAIKDFDASTDDAPATSDYEQAGVTGVDSNSIDATNSVIDALSATDRDTPEKIQVVADLVNTILDVADGDADSVPTLDADDYAAIGLDEIDEAEEVSLMNTVIAVQTPETLFPFEGLKGIAETVVDVISLADTGVDPELTVKRLSDVGLRSINASTLPAVVEAIKDANVTEVDTLTKLQGIVDGVVDAVVASTIGAFDEDTSANPPSADDYTNVGVTGVTTTTLPAINSIIGSLPAADRDSAVEVQAVVDVVNTILASADGDNTNLPQLSADDFATIGLSQVDTPQKAALMNAVLGSQSASQVSTADDLKAYASAVARTIQTAGGTLPSDESPLTVADFELLGIEGVTEDNIDQVLETLADSGEGEITLASLQAVVEQTNAEQAGPAIPVPAMDLWAMVLLMLMVLWLMQRTGAGVSRPRL